MFDEPVIHDGKQQTAVLIKRQLQSGKMEGRCTGPRSHQSSPTQSIQTGQSLWRWNPRRVCRLTQGWNRPGDGSCELLH